MRLVASRAMGGVCMTKILLLRHGHVEGIQPERFRGRRDIPLSDMGVLQAQAAAQYISTRWRPDAIYTSPLKRCVQTGQLMAARCGLAAETLETLTDLSYGEWQWQTPEEVNTRSPELLDLWRKAPHRVRFPQGDSLADMGARVADALRLVLDRQAGKTVVLVGHDSSLRVLLLQLLELPLSAYWRIAQDPCGVSEVDVSAREARVLRMNETQHLEVKSS